MSAPATPLVSVVIPAFNAGAVLADALASVQSQTFSRYEVFLVNDGSTDQTGEIAQSFARSDPRFKYFEQSNAGAAVARNTGMRQAQGKWIAFLDADDIWLPTKLERQCELAEAHREANFLFTNYWEWDGRQDLAQHYSDPKRFPEGDIGEKLIYWNLFGAPTVMVKHETIEAVGFFDPELLAAQDWDYWLRIAEQGGRVRGLWEPQVRRRLWSGNVSADKVRTARYAVRVLEKALQRPQPASRARHYRRSLKIARAHIEFAQARLWIESNRAAVPPAIWRGWRQHPARLKWLLWYLAVVWPCGLGGNVTAEIVFRKLRRKW